MSLNFYDKVAKKFGAYHTTAKYRKVFSNGIPEKDFKDKLMALSSQGKIALDVGCADGRFTLSVAPYFIVSANQIYHFLKII